MNKYLRLFVFIVLTISTFNCAGLKLKPYLASNIPTIRVLILAENVIQLKLLGHYELFEKNRFKSKLPNNRILTIKISKNHDKIDIFQGGNKIFSGKPITFVAKKRGMQFQIKNKKYRGNIYFQLENMQIQVINSTDVETYIKGVVPVEMGKLEKSEIAALKAQAVASRTYAMKKLEQNNNRTNKHDYDISAGVGDQVYSGTSNQYKLSDWAVDKTFGEVAVYNNSLIHAFYHSTCGGRTEHGVNVFPGEDMPYLQGVADNFGKDDFCKDSPHHRWVESFTIAELKSIIDENNSTNGFITNIVAMKRFESGRIKELDLISGSKSSTLTLRGNRLRRTIRKPDGNILRSNLFRIAQNGSKDNPTGFLLIGAGNGHGVGMCQWGAIGMSREGFNYKQILKHYYRGIKIKKYY